MDEYHKVTPEGNFAKSRALLSNDCAEGGVTTRILEPLLTPPKFSWENIYPVCYSHTKYDGPTDLSTDFSEYDTTCPLFTEKVQQLVHDYNVKHNLASASEMILNEQKIKCDCGYEVVKEGLMLKCVCGAQYAFDPRFEVFCKIEDGSH
jgi:hypothetical protein